MKQIVFGESVQGASHKRVNMECQDTFKKLEYDDGTVIMAIADGPVSYTHLDVYKRQVGMWDCVAFDEIAGINFKDKDGVQIMKDYMASGSFARGKEEKSASASMVFVGNINQDVSVPVSYTHLIWTLSQEPSAIRAQPAARSSAITF